MMFEVTLLTESANHKRYRVSLRSSSKRVPSNPSPNGVFDFVLPDSVGKLSPVPLALQARSPCPPCSSLFPYEAEAKQYLRRT